MKTTTKWLAAALALSTVLVSIAACGGGAGGECASICDKAQQCGDIDSVKGDQCRAKCDANADTLQQNLDKCINAGDIVSATNECLSRACSDYAKCLLTLPACKM
jgi:hypothetical protein